MKTPILGSSYVARTTSAAANRMVNLFPEVVPEAGKEPGFLTRAPGLRLLATIGDGPIRALWRMGPYLYVVSGRNFYKVDSSYNETFIGDVTGTGPVSIADNGIQIFLAANGPSYIYNTVTEVYSNISSTAGFQGAVTVGYIDGYFVYNQPNSQVFWVTSLLDGTTTDPLDFASAEGSPDKLVALIVDHQEIWLFGTNSVEVWYDAGSPDFPLQRIQGAFNELGCAAAYSVAKMDNGLFWLGADARGTGMVYRANGYTGQRISTHAVEWQIQRYGDISDAIGYTYQQDGHSFYVLTFPSANATWVYDVSANAWHERASWVDGNWARHRSNCQASFNNLVVVGDYENGNLYALDLDYFTDNGQPQRWLRSWRALPTGQNDLKRSAHHNLQLDIEVGMSPSILNDSDPIDIITEGGDYLVTESGDFLITGFGTSPVDAQLSLRWSDDGGKTWGNYHTISMGDLGDTGKRVIWRRLGMTQKLRDRVYEVSGADAARIYIMGAELFASATNA